VLKVSYTFKELNFMCLLPEFLPSVWTCAIDQNKLKDNKLDRGEMR
jgi:hypothetical protein